MANKPEVNVFDKSRAKELLKICPKLVQDYVFLLEKIYQRQIELTNLAIQKLRDLSRNEV